MTSTIQSTGSCLCKAVTITADALSTHAGACHCNMCRKWGGGPFMSLECQGEISITGEENITRFGSSQWANRGFCKGCGTHLFYHLIEQNQYMVPAGLFEAEAQLHFDHQIFVDEKPDYYHFSNETTNMTGEEVFALFAQE